MRLQLFDDDDLKAIETTIAKALVRAIRTLVRDGTLQLGQGARDAARDAAELDEAQEAPAAQPVAKAPAPEPAPVVVPPTAPTIVPPAAPAPDPEPPAFRRYAERAHGPTAIPIPPPSPVAAKRARRSARDVCKTVGDRPFGYIPTDEASDLIGGSDIDRWQIGQWVLNREISAVIVANMKPPTKGLPGRLMVEKQSLLARHKLRRENALMLPKERRQPERMAAD